MSNERYGVVGDGIKMIGDVYVIKMFGTLLAEQTLNQFFYRQKTGVDADHAFDIFGDFDDEILAPFVNCIHDDYDLNQLEVYNTRQPTMYWSGTPTNNQGTRTWTGDQRAPSFCVFSYKSNRSGAGSRSSYKRFSGLLDADFSGNGLTSTFSALQAVIDLRDALNGIFVATDGSQYEPVQVKAGWTIAIPPIVNFVLNSWSSATFSSQVSRKP